MRRVVRIVVVLIVLFLVLRLGNFWKSAPVVPPTPTSGGTQVQQPPTNPTTTPSPTVSVPRSSDPAVAAVVDEMLAAWDKISAFHAKVETSMPEAAGHKGKTQGKGDYWLQKKDGRLQIHVDLFNVLTIMQEDKSSLVTGEKLISVIDGVNLYTFTNQPGHREAVKRKLNYDDVLQIAGPYLFRDLVTNNKLTLLPEEMKDDHATKVIKAVPNDGSRESLHYFDKATGVRVYMAELDAQGQTALEIKLLELNTNPTFGEEQFKPFVPEGVTLEDQSNLP